MIPQSRTCACYWNATWSLPEQAALPNTFMRWTSRVFAIPPSRFSAVRREGELLGVGALKRLDAVHVEIKSMHTSVEARGRGVGRAMVDHLLAVAADQHYRRVSLETGTADDFAPARSMYLKLGFLPCEPFGIYTVNPYSVCMTLELDPPLTASPGDEPGATLVEVAVYIEVTQQPESVRDNAHPHEQVGTV